MPIKIPTKPDGSFYSGSKWQNVGPFATVEQASNTFDALSKGEQVAPKDYEATVNYFAWQLLHFANSEWGNDYQAAHDALAMLATYRESNDFWTNPVTLNKTT